MSTSMRAKMVLQSIKKYPEEGVSTQENLSFMAIAKSEAYPEDGGDEDNTYAKFTPSASVNLTVCNPALLGQFAVGEKYYVDFTPVSM